MRQFILTLSDSEDRVLQELAKKHGLGEEAVMRQALRLYQHVSENAEANRQMLQEAMSISKAPVWWLRMTPEEREEYRKNPPGDSSGLD